MADISPDAGSKIYICFVSFVARTSLRTSKKHGSIWQIFYNFQACLQGRKDSPKPTSVQNDFATPLPQAPRSRYKKRYKMRHETHHEYQSSAPIRLSESGPDIVAKSIHIRCWTPTCPSSCYHGPPFYFLLSTTLRTTGANFHCVRQGGGRVQGWESVC